MRKCHLGFLILALCMILNIVACGLLEESPRELPEGYYVIKTKTETLFAEEVCHSDLPQLGSQYIQGQAVQLRAEIVNVENEDATLNIYACGTDGGKNLVLENVPIEYLGYNLYLCADNTGILYGEDGIVGVGVDGKIHFRSSVDGKVRDVCQLPDGRVYILICEEKSSKVILQELNVQTGKVITSGSVYLGTSDNAGMHMYITSGEAGLYLLDETGVYDICLEDGTVSNILSFRGTAYKVSEGEMIADFSVTEINQVNVIRNMVLEEITYENIAESRKALIFSVSGAKMDDLVVPLRNSIAMFNQSQEEYYVVAKFVEEGENLLGYRQRNLVELMAGDGPDIMLSSTVTEVESLIEKGVVLQLNSYMEESGVNEEDYFPMTFDWYRTGEEIYGVHMYLQAIDTVLPKSFLGENEAPTITELVELLKDNEEQMIFSGNKKVEAVLEYLLCGSEDLWGMIDWEENTCAFDTQLFKDILFVANRYRYDETRADYPRLEVYRNTSSFYAYDSYEQLEAEGNVSVGYFFKDGNHFVSNATRAIAINANSQYKEGAWEFLHYLLTEGQYMFDWQLAANYPTLKGAYDAWVQKEIEEGSFYYTQVNGHNVPNYKAGYDAVIKEENGVEKYRALYDLTPERVEEIKGMLEETRLLPTKTLPILDIIYEETAAYFAGAKKVEDIIPIIQNRVQLYLDERKD